MTERKDDLAAQTHSKNSYTKEEFIDLMLQRGTLVTKTDVLAVLNNMKETTPPAILEMPRWGNPKVVMGFNPSDKCLDGIYRIGN
ncbi:MAG: hypothetical protein LBP87_11920 [Planctomycetaceae bacterium]|nr:hypothetical protein [Planctomycetaceae bacterium]